MSYALYLSGVLNIPARFMVPGTIPYKDRTMNAKLPIATHNQGKLRANFANYK